MTESYVICTCSSDNGLLKLERMLNKILPGDVSINRIDREKVLLTMKNGLHDQAVLKASYSALLVDNDSLDKALIIPSPSSIFYSYVDFVPSQQITELFKVAKTCAQVYDETYSLIASMDREILETVQVYIENNCSPLLSSYALFVHKNTVTYRINIFIKKTGISLDSFANQMFLYGLINSHKDMTLEEF